MKPGWVRQNMTMSRKILLLLLLLGMPVLAGAAGKAFLLEIEGPIGPATSDFILRGLEKAHAGGAELVILRMDTPGGLDTAMRDIIQGILASPVPVAGYVAPAGARAASAGTYILYASHIAAMAPVTNLGAATPVQIGGMPEFPGREEPPDKQPEKPSQEDAEEKPDKPVESPKTSMERKIINDARAYIRSLAQMRGRNAEWAEQAVTEAASLSAEDALKRNVIDLIAVDEQDLLGQVDGREVQVGTGKRALDTAEAQVEIIEPDWRNRLLAVITNPQVAYILMLIGMYGLFFELANPGSLVPGVLGAICLLLALFAFQVLPVNYAGLALILLGLIFMVAEAFAPSFGVLGLGGIVAFIAGSLILWEEDQPGFDVPIGLIVGFALASATVFIGLSTMFVRQRRRRVVTGKEELVGASGVVVEDFDDKGWVRVHSESWRARAETPLKKNERVRVVDRDGLILHVQPLKGEKNAD